MSLKTLFDKILKKDSHQIASIPIYRLETPDKIVETKIQPVKIPTIFDISERLANISHVISALRNDMVSITWFKNEFQDISPSIIDKLNEINENLRSLQATFSNFTNVISSKLSNFTKNDTIPQTTDFNFINLPANTSEIIYEIIKTNKRIRYRDIIKRIPVSDPTLAKYLKILISNNKVRRTKIAKAVFYEAI